MAPAYELYAYDKNGDEELLATLICDRLDVRDDESRAQAEQFLERRFGEEGMQHWLRDGAHARIVA